MTDDKTQTGASTQESEGDKTQTGASTPKSGGDKTRTGASTPKSGGDKTRTGASAKKSGGGKTQKGASAKKAGAGKTRADALPPEFAHDLLSPLAGIASIADAIADGTVPENRRKLLLGIISSQARRLSRIADSVLIAACLGEGTVKLRFSRFSLTELAKRTLLTFEKPVEERGLSVSFKEEGAARVSADADLVGRVLSNLIENAVKYTKTGGKIQVETGETADGKAVFTVKNEAENPLTEEELSHITERFFRTESAKNSGEIGTGLGLYTVKAALVLHGAELKAESSADGVVSFSFALKKA